MTQYANLRTKELFGFTLLELIISIGILAMLSGLTIANFHGGARNEAVRQAALLAASLLRQAQTMTLSGTVLASAFPPGGYGVRFDTAAPNILIFFADANGNFDYDNGEELTNERLSLPAGARFNLGAELNVVFSPPDANVYFNGAASPDTFTIPFQGSGTAITRTVMVYRLSGQVRGQ